MGLWMGLLAAVLLRGLRAAPPHPAGLQEQEINLKLRILVPRENRHQSTYPLGQLMGTAVSPHPMPLLPDAPLGALGLATLPSRLPASPHPVSVVSSVSSLSSPLSIPLSAPLGAPLAGTLIRRPPVSQTYLIARPGSYRSRRPAVRTVYSQQPYSYPYAPVHAAGYHAWPGLPGPHTGIQYNYLGPFPPKRINITMVQSKPEEAPAKACNCSNATDSGKVVEEEEQPAPVVEDVPEDTSSTPKPIPDAWLGYIPPDVLDHAKNVLLRGKVNVEKDQVRFRQKWKHSNYPQHHQQQKIPGVGEDLWKALKDELKDLTTNDESGDFHDHDAEFDDSASDGFDDGHDYEMIQEEEDEKQPHFVDFWGNRIPKYINGFKGKHETEEDAAHDYNSDPHGWNPEYTKGLWADNDQHLQVFSGHQQQIQQNPNEPKPVYDNGMGEGYDENYNKYVTDNGTWVGRPTPPMPDNLQEILKGSVSYEEGLENPSDDRATYADVIRYLNSKKLPMRLRRRRRPRPRLRLRPVRPRPPPPLPPKASVQSTQHNPNLVDVNQLVEALILHKEKERARNKAEQSSARVSMGGNVDYEDAADDQGDEEEEEVQMEADDRPPSRTSNAHTSPPSSVCKGVRDVGVTQDGHEMEHVQGVVCVNNYDYSAEEGAAEAAAEVDRDAADASAR